MKTLGKLKLNQLNKDELTQREMEYLRGGGSTGNCVCGCTGDSSLASNSVANSNEGPSSEACKCGCNGPSSTSTNMEANSNGGPTSGGSCMCCCTTLHSTSSNLSANSDGGISPT